MPHKGKWQFNWYYRYMSRLIPHQLTFLLADVRSAQNVGVIMRTADALDIDVWTSGLTPHPSVPNDIRPPHVADRAKTLIAKTALGAEAAVFKQHYDLTATAVTAAHHLNWQVLALELSSSAKNLFEFHLSAPSLLIVGHERLGLDNAILHTVDKILAIPMFGFKESLNVAVAASIAGYHLRLSN